MSEPVSADDLSSLNVQGRYEADPRAASHFALYESRKLNLGSGSDIREGFLNIDMHDYRRSNTMVGNVLELPTLPSGNFDEIVAQDVIEHVRWRDTPALLMEWNRLLAVGGSLYIRTTWLNGLTRLFEREDFQTIPSQFMLLANLFANQLSPGDFHFIAFTEPMMRFFMWSTGFTITKIQIMDHWIFEVWAEKVKDTIATHLRHHTGDDRDFVVDSYREILGRSPDDFGLSSFVSNLKQNANTREQVLSTIFASEEKQDILRRDAPQFQSQFVPGKE